MGDLASNLGYDPNAGLTGDLSVSDYSAPSNPTDYAANLGYDPNSLTSGTLSLSNVPSSSLASASTSTPSVTGIIGSVSNGISSIINGLTGGQTGTVVDSYGNPVTTENPTTASIGNLAQSLTNGLTSFLPLILIGGLVWFAFSVFSHHRR